jgi:deoxyribodipyrimidine photolyase
MMLMIYHHVVLCCLLVVQEMQKAGIECRSFNADLLYEPWEVMDERGQPLTSFESFWNRWG